MNSRKRERYQSRFYVFILIDLILFSILIGRVYTLQIEQFSDLSSEAIENMYREYEIQAPRGIIFDRYHKPIVHNTINYDLAIYPFEFEQIPENWDRLSKITGIKKEILQKRKNTNFLSPYIPVKIISSIDFNMLSKIQEHIIDIPGIVLISKPVRNVSEGATAAHLLGYTNEINKTSIEKYKKLGYKSGDIIGIKGIEKSYENILKGKKGRRFVRVNALGRDFGEDFTKTIEPIRGNDLFLTLDWELQSYVETLFENMSGCAITINYHSGEILSFVSKPDYDTDIFSGILKNEDWISLTSDTLKPLFNRLVQAQYPPGSIFKMVTAIAGLEEGLITEDQTFFCGGVYQLGRRPFRCWKPAGHGSVNLVQALEGSCNIYFYNAIQSVGIDMWYKYADIFGFGKPTGIDIPNESSGLLPSGEYMTKRYGRSGWGIGNLLNLSIGQGEILVTPVQLASYISTLASKGEQQQLHLMKAYYDQESEKIIKIHHTGHQLDQISDKTWNLIHEGMKNVIQGENGTAKKVNIKGMNIHGKTGTAQNPHGDNHAWFITFSKSNEYPIAQVLFVEYGGSGSGTAAPLAKKIYEFYRNKQD